MKYSMGQHPNSQKQLISNYWVGKKMSKETKEKMSKSHKGKNTWSKGRSLPIEHRKKLSESAKKYWGIRIDKDKQKEYERIRHSLEMRLWREAVFKRDNYTCVWCGDNKGGNLNADHIQEFAYHPELRFAIDNGRTLCVSCHKKRHYGRPTSR